MPKVICVRLADDVAARLDEFAEADGMDRSGYVRKLIEGAVGPSLPPQRPMVSNGRGVPPRGLPRIGPDNRPWP